jgi:hypothetical protein
MFMLILSMLAFSNPVSASGNTYYVATNGSDINTGTLSAPWKTVQYAANKVSDGDTVYIRGGIYNEQIIFWYKGNASGPYITFSNYQNELVIIDGTGIVPKDGSGNSALGYGLIHIQRSDYIRITGLTVKNSNGAGLPACVSKSIDDGAHWSTGAAVFANGTQRPYFKTSSNGTTRIDFAVNDGHPGRSEERRVGKEC